jgi:PAS domain-containing protein
MTDGSIRHISNIAHRYRSETGHAEILGAIVDITERKTAENKIRAQEAELRQILDLAPQIIGVLGPGRERVYASRFALDYRSHPRGMAQANHGGRSTSGRHRSEHGAQSFREQPC